MNANTTKKTERKRMEYSVTGDFAQLIYSRHYTERAAIAEAKKLSVQADMWHPGSEAMVRLHGQPTGIAFARGIAL